MIFHSNHSSWAKVPTISQFVITSNGNDSAIPQVHLLERCTTNQFDLLPVEAALEPSASDEIEHLAPEDEDVEQISEERRTKIMKEIEAIHRGLGHPCLQHMLKITEGWKCFQSCLPDRPRFSPVPHVWKVPDRSPGDSQHHLENCLSMR